MHRPVLYQEIIHFLSPQRGGRYVDATLGAGGHAWGILETSAPDGLLLGMDVDPQALKIARQKLSVFSSRAILRRGSYTTLAEQLADLNWQTVDGIVLDLGVSSMQLDTPQRGFSFQEDAPLDMRFDPDNPVRAADLVNSLSEAELTDLLWRYGEERRARQVAKAIVKSRPLETTRQLAQVVSQATSAGRPGMHPATRTFQALRLAVNGELDSLQAFLPLASDSLAPGGRLAVISFHSLEDRIVKQYFVRESKDCICPPRQPVCTCGHRASLRILTRRPVRPDEAEVKANPRSRSAKLRVAEKIG
ncbi:MAG: 16S rRNA (cytosine(1402)-N(4))-methyltransferase RsmH [Anaerolineales bacterium]